MNMLLLTAIEECDCVITAPFTLILNLGSPDPAQCWAALRRFLGLCQAVDVTTTDVLSNAAGAAYVQLYRVPR